MLTCHTNLSTSSREASQSITPPTKTHTTATTTTLPFPSSFCIREPIPTPPSLFYPINLFMKVGLVKGQQYSLGTGPLTLHSKKENMGNQMRARRLCW